MFEKSDSITAVMSDLENGKKVPEVVVTTTEAPLRPMLGRRKTSGSIEKKSESKTGFFGSEGEEDALTRIGNVVYKIHSASILTRYALYILPVATLLAVPLLVTSLVRNPDGTYIEAGGIRLMGLFIWIEVIWVALWFCKLVASTLPVIFQSACGLISTGIRKYSLVLMALEIPMSLFLWTIVTYATVPVVCVFNQDHCNAPWLDTLATVFKAGIVVAAIFLAEKTFIQLIAINYHRKQYAMKIKESKKLIRLLDHLYDASRTLFPEFGRDFEEEDMLIQGNTLADVRTAMAKAGVRTRVFNDIGRVRDKMAAAFGAMASDISGKQVFSTTSAHSIVLEALETERASKALARRLWLSFVSENKDALYRQDLVDVLGTERSQEADEIFSALDRDGNGDVSLEEMTMLVLNVGHERKNRATSMHDINQAIAVLDRLLSLVVLGAIAFIYATFFSATFAAKTTQLWTTFTGLAFAIGGTVTEFLSACIFLFVKHPYDVGDRVTISDVELVVEHISLMYSVFRRIDTDAKVQIPHNVAGNLWIENVSRSRSMKERISLHVSAATSTEDMVALRQELHRFVTSSDNSRDFQPHFDVELRGLGDLKALELRVELRHKSNFTNETLRNTRRNKFMVELLDACRRIPIEPPGGSAPALGDPSNPSYSVALTDLEAIAARETHKQETTSKRLFPVGQFRMDGMGQGGFSTGSLINPAQAMMSNLVGVARRNNSVVSNFEGVRQ